MIFPLLPKVCLRGTSRSRGFILISNPVLSSQLSVLSSLSRVMQSAISRHRLSWRGMDRDDSRASSPVSLSRSAWRWWNNLAGREGRLSATRQLLVALWEFVRDSTPERRRQRYGDTNYDWDHRVNTTSA